MAIVIAILLALILVAMMNSNKAAHDGVFNFVRISFIAGLIILTWLICVAYFIFFYSAYTTHEWYDLIGIIFVGVVPPLIMWFAREDLILFFKQEDQKKVFKVLLLCLLAAIFIALVGAVYQEYKKTNPYIGQQILWSCFAINGFILYRRSLKLPRGWRDLIDPPTTDTDNAYAEFCERNNQEFARFEQIEASFDSIDGAEEIRLKNENSEIFKKSQEILDKRLAEIASKRNIDDYLIQAFIYICVFIGIGWAIDLWWFAYDYALTLDFVGGSPMWAGGFVIVLALGAIAVVNDLVERFKKKP